MSSFWRGFRDALPFLLVLIPFALLFGVLATEAGLNIFETLAFSIVVIAGAAQFTALQLMSENAPAVVALVSALAVNMRMAMYSASMTPYLGSLPLWKRALVAYGLVDQSFALASAKFEASPEMPVNHRFWYFLGTVVPILPGWYIGTLVGALAGETIPSSMGLDFALPIAFVALISPMLRTPAHRGAALSASLLALGFAWLPFNFGLMVGGLGGMMVGAEIERRMGQ
ncbi:AzlC family ABC transporter permease [Thalassococcus lentus]|uniref:AzlC family ABC transporter permease n=2 Tax=Thalassococcus lentus TaxID=1210524 RepID=A0ABT4XSR1_9RHOB|nr:AzlC family ABC transporter permease [Thalassococcus lentus]MDA7424976.1 AzlC family ABC transporter permease [Thalassococcus lentus]